MNFGFLRAQTVEQQQEMRGYERLGDNTQHKFMRGGKAGAAVTKIPPSAAVSDLLMPNGRL